MNTGRCRFGARCRYQHVAGSEDPAALEHKNDDRGPSQSGSNRRSQRRSGGNGTSHQQRQPQDGFVLRVNEFTSTKPFVDTHIHVDMVLEKMRCDWKSLVHWNYPENFDGCVAIFSDPTAFSPSFGTWSDHLQDERIFGAFGMHPHNAKYYSDSMEERILKCLEHEKAVALGEIGLDFHYNRSPPDVQRNVFRRQLSLARQLEKPVVIHSRAAEQDTVSILKEILDTNHRIHLHCFNDSASYAKDLMDHFPNLFVGITGAVTFASASPLRKIIADKVVPLERILLETDGPYMTPTTGGGGGRKPACHSGHIPIVAATIAQLLEISLDEVLEQTRANTTQMYGF